MGDTANVLVRERNSQVYLYTHWNGSELPKIVQRALKRKQCWDDGQYLARIIFCEMIKGYEDGETGYGISSVVGDGNNRIVSVYVDDQTIQLNNGNILSFEDFIEMEEPTW